MVSPYVKWRQREGELDGPQSPFLLSGRLGEGFLEEVSMEAEVYLALGIRQGPASLSLTLVSLAMVGATPHPDLPTSLPSP